MTLRLAMAASALVLIAALIGAVVLTFRTDYVALPVATPTPRPTVTRTAVLATAPASANRVANADMSGTPDSSDGAGSLPTVLDLETRLSAAGFAYRPVDGFSETVNESAATLSSNAADLPLPPVFLLSAGPRTQYAAETDRTLDAAFEHFVAFFARQDNFQVGQVQELTVDGVAARSVDLQGGVDTPFAGRIVMAQPDDERLFVMTGVAPSTHWADDVAAAYAAVLDSVTLFPPSQDEPAALLLVPTATPTTAPTRTRAPTPTPIPASQPLPTPDPRARLVELPSVHSNANFMAELALTNNTRWAATQGGIVGWNRRSGDPVKFTVADGLIGNAFDTTAYCPLPGLGVVFGGMQGLQIFDARNGTWNTLNSDNSGMSYDDVATVRCSAEDAFLVVGYRQHGLDIFDAESSTWTHYDRSSGLSSDAVRAVAVVGDREEIWVTSGSGITVLSAASPVNYTASNSPLTVNQVDALLATSSGTVWIAAPGTLHRIDDGQWLTYPAAAVSGPFPAGPVAGMDVDNAGRVWLVSDAGEVCQFDAETVACVTYFEDALDLNGAAPTSLIVDDDGSVIVSTDGKGLRVYADQRWRTERAPDDQLASNQIFSMAETRDGFIWLAGDQGVQQISPTDPAVQRRYQAQAGTLPIDDVRVVAADLVGLWLGGAGAAYFDGKDWTVYTPVDGLAGGTVQAIALDSQMRTWLGAQRGLSIWNGETFFNLTTENGLPNDDITALLADGDAMWIGSNGGGLYRFTSNQLRIFDTESAALPSNVITALGLGQSGEIWVGTDAGLARFVDETAAPVTDLPAGPITAMTAAVPAEAESGTPWVWAGVENQGVFRYDGERWLSLGDVALLPAMQIRAILVDRYDTVWIGGEQGGMTRNRIDE